MEANLPRHRCPQIPEPIEQGVDRDDLASRLRILGMLVDLPDSPTMLRGEVAQIARHTAEMLTQYAAEVEVPR